MVNSATVPISPLVIGFPASMYHLAFDYTSCLNSLYRRRLLKAQDQLLQWRHNRVVSRVSKQESRFFYCPCLKPKMVIQYLTAGKQISQSSLFQQSEKHTLPYKLCSVICTIEYMPFCVCCDD